MLVAASKSPDMVEQVVDDGRSVALPHKSLPACENAKDGIEQINKITRQGRTKALVLMNRI